MSEVDMIDHPPHYNMHPSGIEAIDVIEHMTFNIGAAIKYLWRCGLKDGEPQLTDLRKSLWFINREISRVEKEHLEPDRQN